MTETETASPASASTTQDATTPAKDKKPAAKREKKPKKTPEHPKYSDMITAALEALNDRSGSSRQALIKYIVANYKIEESKASNQLRLALKRLVSSGTLKQVKGAGASGSFKLAKGDEIKPAVTNIKAPKVPQEPKKTVTKKAPKAAAKKPKGKKKSTPKKTQEKGSGKRGKKGSK